MIIARPAPEKIDAFFTRLHTDIWENYQLLETVYLDLSVRTVRVLIFSEGFIDLIHRHLSCVIMPEEPSRYDSTLIVWKTGMAKKAHPEVCWTFDERYSKFIPIAVTDEKCGKIDAYDRADDTYYFGYGKLEPEDISVEGHLFVRTFYKILKTPHSTLIHGACVGIDGKGVLVCARGNHGKSTLTVLSLLRGFEYVSDDYLVLEERDGKLYASPIYDIVTLSPKMYNAMYDELTGCRFISNNWNNTKYVFEVSSHRQQFRYGYPISICLFPEISQTAGPSIEKCDEREKGKAVTHIIHSTIFQMEDIQDRTNVLKLTNMFKGLDFCRFTLSSDIFANVEYLKKFIIQ